MNYLPLRILMLHHWPDTLSTNQWKEPASSTQEQPIKLSTIWCHCVGKVTIEMKKKKITDLKYNIVNLYCINLTFIINVYITLDYYYFIYSISNKCFLTVLNVLNAFNSWLFPEHLNQAFISQTINRLSLK